MSINSSNEISYLFFSWIAKEYISILCSHFQKIIVIKKKDWIYNLPQILLLKCFKVAVAEIAH